MLGKISNKNEYILTYKNELISLKNKQKELYKFRASINEQLIPIGLMHNLRIINAALPYGDHLISISEKAMNSVHNLSYDILKDISEYKIYNGDFMTMKVNMSLAKDIHLETDAAIESLSSLIVL